jgi:hypothetical protein
MNTDQGLPWFYFVCWARERNSANFNRFLSFLSFVSFILGYVSRCSMARIVWNIPCLLLPPLIMDRLMPFLPRVPSLRMAAELVVITSLIFIGVPPALALFPQRDSLPGRRLEPEFHGHERLFFNKGL